MQNNTILLEHGSGLKSFYQRATWAIAQQFEGRAFYVMWLFRDIQFYLNKMIGLTMRSATWNRFPNQNLWLIPCFFHLWSDVTCFGICYIYKINKFFVNTLIFQQVFC